MGCKAIGKIKEIQLSAELQDVIRAELGFDVDRAQQFQRAVIGKSLYHSELYTRVKVRNSYTVCYHDGGEKYGLIRFFLSIKDHVIAVVSPLGASTHYCHPTEISDLCTCIIPVEKLSNVVAISVKKIVCKCILVSTGQLYVAKFLQCLKQD